ncbi:MAG: CPXCG motif-containing cysteine-rich protein [bacterium]|nr:CPXCG motif-containing cysteine-rich protein [bacterium]
MLEEVFFTCPYCWSCISVLIDVSIYDQQYVEDCEICCRPMHIEARSDGEMVIDFNAESIEQ